MSVAERRAATERGERRQAAGDTAHAACAVPVHSLRP
jgi:hypothetical protein